MSIPPRPSPRLLPALPALPALILVLAPAAGAQELVAAPEGTRPRVLVYTHAADFEHAAVARSAGGEPSLVERRLVELGETSGLFEAVPVRDAAAFTPEGLAQVGAVLFFTSGELPIAAAGRRALFDWVRAGGAFVGVHSAAQTWLEVPEYGKLLGGRIDGVVLNDHVTIRVEDAAHPISAGLPASFEFADEIPRFGPPYARSGVRVLWSLDAEALDLGDSQPGRADGDYPVAWCKSYGRGRVFYTALGNRADSWNDERFAAHLVGGLVWALDPASPAPEPSSSAGLPAVPPGFAVERLISAPRLTRPTALLARDDGSFLVAEQHSVAGERPRARLCLFEPRAGGGHERTVFAEELFGVAGLEEIDGQVFAWNPPRLTRFADRDGDGRAEERRELLEEVELLEFRPGNDWGASGLQLALDGYLYLAVGASGLGVPATAERDAVQLRGPGVLRLRPDGSGLEVIERGGPLPLSLTLDEADERLTSAGGASLVLAGGGWPRGYGGALLVCDDSAGALRRFSLQRVGAGVQPRQEADLLDRGELRHLRPTALAEAPDGSYLLVADWDCPSDRVDPVTGCVWRVAPIRPGGAVANDAERPAGVAEVRLSDPARRARLAAQRHFAAQGPPAVPHLTAVLVGSASERARRGAIWALAEIGTAEALQALTRGIDSPWPATRAEAARALGESGRADPWRVALLADSSPLVRRRAAEAVGRLGDRSLSLLLLLALREEVEGEGDPALLAALRGALVRLDDWETILAYAGEARHTVFDLDFAGDLARALNTIESDATRVRALALLGEIHRELARVPAQPEKGAGAVRAALAGMLQHDSPRVRAAAVEAALRSGDPELLVLLPVDEDDRPDESSQEPPRERPIEPPSGAGGGVP